MVSSWPQYLIFPPIFPESALASILSENDFLPWIDIDRLKPGTPDWEEEIRREIAASQVVIYLASPTSRQSPFVRAEIEIARTCNVRIVSFWIEGTSWSDAAPMSLVSSQFIDGRNEQNSFGITTLLKELSKI